MKLRKNIAVCMTSTLLALTLTGCSTTVGTSYNSYIRYMKEILGVKAKTSAAASSAASAATEISSPASFVVNGDTFTFAGVEHAEQYILYLCAKGSTNDSDDFMYSGVVDATGAAEYTGSLRDLTNCAYGEYTAKVFAVAADYTMSKGVLADYSINGELPAPELAYSYDGHGILTLQVANTEDYEASATPDEILVTIEGPSAQEAKFDSAMSDFDIEKMEAGDYTITAVAKSSSAWVTAEQSKAFELTVSLGSDEIASDNYTKPQGMGGGPGGGGFEIKPTGLQITEGESGFTFKVGDHDLFKTTATLAETPDEGAVYTYDLAQGDPNAPFTIAMKLNLMADGTAELNIAAGGPVTATRKYGTWTNNGGVIDVAW